MKILASYLALMLAAQPAAASLAEEPAGVETDTFTVTAPRVSRRKAEPLELARAGGASVAAAGAGLMAYVVVAGTGPFGWAAALVFLGGMSAYLAHRRLSGKDDFGPTNSRPPRPVPQTLSVAAGERRRGPPSIPVQEVVP